MSNENALTVSGGLIALEYVRGMSKLLASAYRGEVLRSDVDYGIIPGTTKPTLLKPGAEKICALFDLSVKFNAISRTERWEEPMLFAYEYECVLTFTNGRAVAASGACNSHEDKWHWVWVSEDKLLPGVDKSTLPSRDSTISEFDFAIKKAETTGQYGKPAEYWQAFRDAINNGTAVEIDRVTKSGKKMDAWEIPGRVYRVVNPNITDVNKYIKMAQKRALIAAVLIATGASEFFTQDMETIEDLDTVDSTVAKTEAIAQKPERPAAPITPIISAAFLRDEKRRDTFAGQMRTVYDETTERILKALQWLTPSAKSLVEVICEPHEAVAAVACFYADYDEFALVGALERYREETGASAEFMAKVQNASALLLATVRSAKTESDTLVDPCADEDAKYETRF